MTAGPPLGVDALWWCPVCGYVPPEQYADNPGDCPFSWRGGGTHRDFRHPYGDDREPTAFVRVGITLDPGTSDA